jgi:hypothetical protein
MVKFEASQGYTVRSYLKKLENKNKIRDFPLKYILKNERQRIRFLSDISYVTSYSDVIL